jgi:hypothetical protein
LAPSPRMSRRKISCRLFPAVSRCGMSQSELTP